LLRSEHSQHYLRNTDLSILSYILEVTMKFGKVKFYADSNVELPLVEFIRDEGFKVLYAPELGLGSRDDDFHLQEAQKRKCVLLTRDEDYLNNRKFPFSRLKETAIVVFCTRFEMSHIANFANAFNSLVREIGSSGNKNLYGAKIEIRGPKMVLQALVGGRILRGEVDTSKGEAKGELFAE
jgi:hypothetical protein